MGAAPGPSPSKVATEFARVYYKVVATLPTRLSELYGDESQLDHGPSHRASGRRAISDVSKDIPLTNHPATIDSVIGQSSANGNVVVAVRGFYSSPPIPFVQTFLLAKQSDSHDEHFYCCNDIFLSLQSEQTNHVESDVAPHESLPEPLTPPKVAPEPAKELKTTPPSSMSSSDNPVELPSSVSTVSPSTALLSKTTEPVSSENIIATSVPASVISDKHITESSSQQDSPQASVTLPSVTKNDTTPPVLNEVTPKDKDRLLEPASVGTVPVPSPATTNITKSSSPEPVNTELDSSTDLVHDFKDGVDVVSTVSNQTDKQDISNNTVVSSKPSQSKKPGRGTFNRNFTDRKSDQDFRTSNTSANITNSYAAAPARKTWASIVLSREGAREEVKSGGGNFILEKATNGTEVKVSNDSMKAPLVGEAAPTEPISEIDHEKNSPSTSIPEASSKAVAVSNPERPPNPANGGEGENAQSGPGRGSGGVTGMAGGTNGRPMYSGRGNPRVFGPSAVVTLSSTGMSLSDVQALRNSLREEFSRYGHSLRGVEVKAAKGIAFLEYDSMDGVRAAVDAWAHGPRKDGVFAGVGLHVSEKRTAHVGRRPGASRGGSRGGARGGSRRGRLPPAAMT